MTQEAVGQAQVVPPVPTGSGTPQTAAGAIPQTAPVQPAPSQVAETPSIPSGPSVEELQKTLERVKGAQAAADRRAYLLEQQMQQERAQLLAQLEQKQLEQLPPAQKEEYERQTIMRRLQQAEAKTQDLEWRAWLTNIAATYQTQGVPIQMLQEAMQAAPTPQQAAMQMQAAAAEYWRQQALAAKQGPAPQPAQPQQRQYQQAPVAPPVTAHASPASQPSYEETLQELREQTRKTKEDTTLGAYEAIVERERAQRGGV